MSRYAIVLFFAALMVSTLGCSKGGLLTLERNPASHILESTTGGEFVSASAQYENTLLNGYHVQQSVGDFIPNIEQTSGNGYKYYSTMQGQILCEAKGATCTKNADCCSNSCTVVCN